jgi:hypothetical protein
MDQNNSTRFKKCQAVVVLKREVDVKLMAFLGIQETMKKNFSDKFFRKVDFFQKSSGGINIDRFDALDFK